MENLYNSKTTKGGSVMAYKLFTKKELAERWQVSTKTIDNYINNGILNPVKCIGDIRFRPEDIEILEANGKYIKKSAELLRLERTNEELKEEIINLKGILTSMQALCSKALIID